MRYDTVVDGIWHGFAMLVASDQGSDYSTVPSLRTKWDTSIRKVEGVKIYAYEGNSFWRFKLEVPMGENEEQVMYSVNVRCLVLLERVG